MLVMFSLFCPLPCLHGVLEFAPSVSNVLIILSTFILHGVLEFAHSVCSHYFVHYHVFVECSSLPLVLVMYSLFCPLPCLRGVLELPLVLVKFSLFWSPLPCLRGVLEFAHSVSNVLIILSTSMSSWSARVCP